MARRTPDRSFQKLYPARSEHFSRIQNDPGASLAADQKRVDMPKLNSCTSSLGLLLDRDRIVDTDRTERRCPHQADDRPKRAISYSSTPDRPALIGDLVAVERRRIGKHRATQAEALGNDRQRELGLGRRIEIGRAAEMVAAGAGSRSGRCRHTQSRGSCGRCSGSDRRCADRSLP